MTAATVIRRIGAICSGKTAKYFLSNRRWPNFETEQEGRDRQDGFSAHFPKMRLIFQFPASVGMKQPPTVKVLESLSQPFATGGGLLDSPCLPKSCSSAISAKLGPLASDPIPEPLRSASMIWRAM